MRHPFADLSPDHVLDAVESVGFHSDARVMALNSYENRVYQVGIEEAQPLIVKFYRPGRWQPSAIREEHAFSQALAAMEVPVVAPLQQNGETLFEYGGFHFALFPRRGGHPPELDNPEQRYQLGQRLGRLHALGAVASFQERKTLTPETYGQQALAALEASPLLPSTLAARHHQLARQLLDQVQTVFSRIDYTPIRLHGDCHVGNILVRDQQLWLVDLDDCCMGPAVQDLWMLLSGSPQDQQRQLVDLLEGYGEFCDFQPAQLHLIEALRSLRLLHYSAWLAQRWDDPAFPRSFPWFAQTDYWQQQIHSLKEQSALLRKESSKLPF